MHWVRHINFFYILFPYIGNKYIIHFICIYIGPKLSLKCQFHNKCIAKVSNDVDFKNLTSCKSKCNTKLSCGHFCNKICHAEDSDHLTLKCTFACTK